MTGCRDEDCDEHNKKHKCEKHKCDGHRKRPIRGCGKKKECCKSDTGCNVEIVMRYIPGKDGVAKIERTSNTQTVVQFEDGSFITVTKTEQCVIERFGPEVTYKPLTTVKTS